MRRGRGWNGCLDWAGVAEARRRGVPESKVYQIRQGEHFEKRLSWTEIVGISTGMRSVER